MNLFKKKKYLDCYMMKHSLHFFYDEIRMCCSNVSGPVLYPNYVGSDVDWNYVYNVRKKYIKKINSFFSKKDCPDECIGCFEVPLALKDKKVENIPNVVEKVYFHNFMSCNAKCSYCTYAEVERGYKYKVLPLVKSLIDEKILSQNACIYMSGGEITIYPEFEELLSLLISYLNSKIEIITSGIKYCASIEEAFIQNKLTMLLSLDSGTRETYKKIKNVDSYESVIDNLRRYTTASENAKQYITLKYILVDGINDNIDELTAFFNVVSELGVKNVRLDVDFQKYSLSNNVKVPNHYSALFDFFNTKAKELNLNIVIYEQVEAILNKS